MRGTITPVQTSNTLIWELDRFMFEVQTNKLRLLVNVYLDDTDVGDGTIFCTKQYDLTIPNEQTPTDLIQGIALMLKQSVEAEGKFTLAIDA